MESLWNIGATLVFVGAFAALVLRWLAFSGLRLPGPFSDPLPERWGEKPKKDVLIRLFFLALIFRIGYGLVTFWLFNTFSGSGLTVNQLPELWCRWDAPHYVRLAQLGYGGYLEDGQPLFLVFYPLYVWLIRGLGLVLGSIPAAGLTVSALCFAGGCCYFWALGVEEYGEPIARQSLLLFIAFPFAFFFGGIMTESLFFLTTAAGLYYIRKHRWLAAGLWGVAAALTRMQGVILLGAAIAELVNEVCPFALTGRERKTAIWSVVKRLPLLCLPVLGSLIYFFLNWSVTGDPFAFTRMQEHWSQGFRWFPEVLAYLADNVLHWPKATTRLEMWLPELLLFPIFALLLWKSWKGHRSMLTLYGTVYFILNYCLNWLLSAGRYLSCALPCFFFAADLLEEKPRQRAALTAVMFALQLIFLFRYFSWGQVM